MSLSLGFSLATGFTDFLLKIVEHRARVQVAVDTIGAIEGWRLELVHDRLGYNAISL
jgi:hypothetical protein